MMLFARALSRLLPLLLLLPLLFGLGCTLKEQPAPSGGELRGTISPATAAVSVRVTGADSVGHQLTPAADGSFAWPSLPPGPYRLTVMPYPSHNAPPHRQVVVEAGRSTDVGTIALEPNGRAQGGTVTWRTDGVAHSASGLNAQLDLARNTFILVATTASNNNLTERLVIDLIGLYEGPATYQASSTLQVGLAYTRYNNGQAVAWYGGVSPLSTGSLTISSYDAVAKTLTGTFHFVGTGQQGTPGSLSVTDGQFALRL